MRSRSNAAQNNLEKNECIQNELNYSPKYLHRTTFLSSGKATFYWSALLLGLLYYFILPSFDNGNETEVDPRAHFTDRRKTREYAVEIDEDLTKEKTIAYAVSLTACGDERLLDGAAVLKHSIHLNSAQNPDSGSKYFYEMVAIVHPQALPCTDSLTKLGYDVIFRDTPVDVTKIKGDFLREHIVKTGCCQEKELIKLWAYTLIDYKVVVHLDLDTIVLQPMDELYDTIIDGPEAEERKIPVMFNATLPQKIDAYFTRDYNLSRPGKKHVGAQGGFFAIRPEMAVFEEYKKIILEGNFASGSGWGKLGFGGFYGAQQIQGILPYYYDHLHPNTAVELNRCYYNSMVDNPRDKDKGICLDGQEKCEDCRTKDVSEIKLAHFTLCQKPWWCTNHGSKPAGTLCKELKTKWFEVRKNLEDSWEQVYSEFKSHNNGKYFSGFCKRYGVAGYIPLEMPTSLQI